MLTTELVDIPSGEAWTPIENTQDAFDIQNTSNVPMEFTYTNTVDKGSILLPNTWVLGIMQTVYVRHKSDITNGTISVVRFSANV